MAAEFHRKTAALFEEFKKREMCYLNTERSTNDSFNWRNDFNMSAQDYLDKINKREREAEKAYNDLMKNLENLDKHTDQMSLKLEKLSALRNIAISSNTATWPSMDDTFNRPLQPYYSSVLHSTPVTIIPSNNPIKTLPSASMINHSLSDFSTESVSTQTEYIFCNQCHSPLTLYSEYNASNRISTSVKSIKTVEPETNKSYQFTVENALHSNPSVLNGSKTKEFDTDRSCAIEKNVEPIQFQEHSNGGSSVPSKLESVSNSIVVENKQAFPNHFDTEDQEQREMNQVDSETIATTVKKKQSLETGDNTLSNTEILEEVVGKSDDESMNHEFDFLESDKKISKKNADTQVLNEVPQIQTDTREIHPSFEKRNSAIDVQKNMSNSKRVSISTEPSNPEVLKQQVTQVSNDTFPDAVKDKDFMKVIDDLRLDSSLSMGAPSPSLQSENASLASESDSSSEKETPLTATAAYQALLGNVSTAKSLQNRRPVTDSDTEDEIENALATAVRKSSNVVFDTGIVNQKMNARKESIVETKPKPETKTSNIVSKPQNKLSKNTRKVLGLETSSGSEVELPANISTKQTAEDSDEFDFYD